MVGVYPPCIFPQTDDSFLIMNDLLFHQDATVKLWVRRPSGNSQSAGNVGGPNLRSWFGFNSGPSFDDQSYSWHCRCTFEPKSEAVRDIRWSPFHDDSELF